MLRPKNHLWGGIALSLAIFLLGSCRSSNPEHAAESQAADSSTAASSGSFVLSSADFQPNGVIPKKFTCSGGNVSPSLQWSGEPGGTHSYALIMEDPDAPSGTWTHWVVFDIPHHVRSLAQGVPAEP